MSRRSDRALLEGWKSGSVRSGEAFTLLEMLAATAIILVLVALVALPVARNVLKRAAVVQCLANLRDIGVVMQQYTQEHEGEILPRFLNATGYWYSESSPLLDYVPSAKALQTLSVCPLNRSKDAASRADVNNKVGFPYTANHYLMPPRYSPARRELPIENPSRRILMADSYGTYDKWRNAFLPSQAKSVIDFKHAEHANVLFLDKHVAPLRSEEIVEDMVLVP